MKMIARHYAGILGSLGFVTVIVHGLLHEASAEATLVSASLGLAGFSLWGLIVGQVAASTISNSVRMQIRHELESRKEGSGN
jgi:hypothetical protein